MEPFIGMIVQFAGNFAPRGWAFCDGQLLAIAQNSALFSILGTTYGGDGRTTFALPDLRGRVPIHPGNGPGLSPYTLGQQGGAESVTLTINNMPSHGHGLSGSSSTGITGDPKDATFATTPTSGATNYTPDNPDVPMNTTLVGHTGGSQPFGIVQPYNCINFIIALQGIYPSRD